MKWKWRGFFLPRAMQQHSAPQQEEADVVPNSPTPAKGQKPGPMEKSHPSVPLSPSNDMGGRGRTLLQNCSSANPKPAGLWPSTPPLPVEEDGFHQGDHIPAGVVSGTHNGNVQELPGDKHSAIEAGPPCTGLSDPPELSQGSGLLPDISHLPWHRAAVGTHLTLVHHPLLGTGRAVAPLAPGGGPILGGGPPWWAAVAAVRLHPSELLAELLVLLLHPAHLQGQRLPLHVTARLLAQAWRQQEKAAICRDTERDVRWTWQGEVDEVVLSQGRTGGDGGTKSQPEQRGPRTHQVSRQRHSSAPPDPKDVPGNLEARYTHSNLHGHRATLPRPWHPLPAPCFP